MPKDKQHKDAIRETARRTGRRYTGLACEMPVAAAGRADLPYARGARRGRDPAAGTSRLGLPGRYVPKVFDSRLLGTVVPYGMVLELAGGLVHEGTKARLTLESLAPEPKAIVVCRQRRIQFLLSHPFSGVEREVPGVFVRLALAWLVRHEPTLPVQHLDAHFSQLGDAPLELSMLHIGCVYTRHRHQWDAFPDTLSSYSDDEVPSDAERPRVHRVEGGRRDDDDIRLRPHVRFARQFVLSPYRMPGQPLQLSALVAEPAGSSRGEAKAYVKASGLGIVDHFGDVEDGWGSRTEEVEHTGCGHVPHPITCNRPDPGGLGDRRLTRGLIRG